MKDFEDMTWEELDQARTRLYWYIDKVRQQKRKEAYKRAKELVNELNSIARGWDIGLVSTDCDGNRMGIFEDIEVIKPNDCD